MTIIRLITNNYLQTLCSLSSSCGGSRLNIALQNPLPSPTRTSLTPSPYILLLPSSLCAPLPPPSVPSVIHVVLFQSLSISSLQALAHVGPLLSSHPQRSVPDRRGAAFPPYSFLLNSDVLFIYLRGALLSQHPSSLFVLPLPERLTIPLASRLIYHPNGGYGRVEKKPPAICRGRQSHRGMRGGGEGCLDCNCCSSSACQRVCLHDQTSL